MDQFLGRLRALPAIVFTHLPCNLKAGDIKFRCFARGSTKLFPRRRTSGFSWWSEGYALA